MIHKRSRARPATRVSRRSMPAAAGRVPTTRSATVPAAGDRLARRPSRRRAAARPIAAQISANSPSTSATAGPRISTPVSRHGSTLAGSPAQASPTHSPDTNATLPSTASILRWSRTSHAKRPRRPRRVEGPHLDAGVDAADTRTCARWRRARPSSRRSAAPARRPGPARPGRRRNGRRSRRRAGCSSRSG